VKKNLRKRGSTYYARIRINPNERDIEKSLHTRDKEVARKRLDELAMQIERESEGLAIPAKVKQAAQLPLGLHLDLYLGEKEREWTSDKYYQLTRDRLKKLMRECQWRTLKDLDTLSFTQWRGRQHSSSSKTLNAFLTCIRGFSDWLHANGFTEADPMKNIRPIKAKGQTFERKALSFEEITVLLESVKDPMRKAVYITAIYTGLRRAEIEGVEYGDLHLDAEVPYIFARAVTTKNGKDASIPLHPAVVDAILTIGKNEPSPAETVFVVPSIERFKEDLKEAKIIYKDDRGNKTDFHALRTTYCTMMNSMGVAPRVAQALMRHSEIGLTMKNYTDANLLPIAKAVYSLPDLTAKTAPYTAPRNPTSRDFPSPDESRKREGSSARNPNNKGPREVFCPLESQGGSMVPGEGLEPSRCYSADFESAASTNFATPAS